MTVAPASATAHDAPESRHDVVSLATESDVEIDNDLMTATLVVQGEAKDAAALAEEINTTTRWALDVLERFGSIEPATRDYRTWPRHDTSESRRLIGWRASRTLELESDDFAAMSEAIAQLQERLQVQGTALAVKRGTRRAATDALIDQALHAFRSRAELIRESLGASGYRILEIDVQSDESVVGPPAMRMRTMAMESAEANVSEPGVAGGKSRVAVRVSGRVQLERTR